MTQIRGPFRTDLVSMSCSGLDAKVRERTACVCVRNAGLSKEKLRFALLDLDVLGFATEVADSSRREVVSVHRHDVRRKTTPAADTRNLDVRAGRKRI